MNLVNEMTGVVLDASLNEVEFPLFPMKIPETRGACAEVPARERAEERVEVERSVERPLPVAERSLTPR